MSGSGYGIDKTWSGSGNQPPGQSPCTKFRHANNGSDHPCKLLIKGTVAPDLIGLKVVWLNRL